MYKFWDPIPANGITLSAMDFINGCLLEEMPIIRDMKISTAAHSWPYYLREKTGCSAAYAFMIFPRENHPDMSVYIPVIEDITLYTNLVNDILSYVFVVPSNKVIVTITLLDSTRSFLPERKKITSTIGHTLLGNPLQTLCKIPSVTHWLYMLELRRLWNLRMPTSHGNASLTDTCTSFFHLFHFLNFFF